VVLEVPEVPDDPEDPVDPSIDIEVDAVNETETELEF
jgi:hypothetical protein